MSFAFRRLSNSSVITAFAQTAALWSLTFSFITLSLALKPAAAIEPPSATSNAPSPPPPSRAFIDSLNVQLTAHSRFDGCRVDEATYEPDASTPQKVTLVLRGRVPLAELGDVIANQIARPTLEQDAAFKTEGLQIAGVRHEFRKIEPQHWRAKEFFQHGHSLYFQHDFAAAADAFQQAAIDSPRTTEFRYWHILALQQSGQTDRAYAYMLALVNRNPLPVTDVAIVRSLERVQGPVRVELLRLRRKAEAEYHLDRRLQRAAHSA